MAGEWVGHNIRVNSISPGIMNTRLTADEAQAELRRLWSQRSPMGIGDSEDLTGAIILLCSDAGKFMIGTDIKIDGRGPACIIWKLLTHHWQAGILFSETDKVTKQFRDN